MSVCLSVLSVQQKQQLDGVVYSSRFAVALFFPPEVVFRFSWSACYVADSSIIRYVAADSRKRNAGLSLLPSVRQRLGSTTDTTVFPDVSGLGPSLVVHTSVSFGLENLEKDKEEVQGLILEELYKLLPELPQPVGVKCQKWRYSQVSGDR